MTYYAAFFIAMCFTLALIPPLLRFASLWGFIDKPGNRKVHKGAIPSVGGIAMIFGTLVPFLIWMPISRTYVSVVAAIAVLFVFGIWDDRKELSYRTKLIGQLIAAGLVVGYGQIIVQWPPFFGQEPLTNYVAIPFTILCLLAITNAMNLADGLDGLAGGATLLSFAFIGVLAYQRQDSGLLLVTLSVVGGILGFLRFNSHPAKIFMGDTGSQFLGFILGVETILLTQSETRALSAALPLMILGLPLVDTISVIFGRLRRKQSPFKADKTHVHHRLLGLGLSHYETVVCLYVVQATFILVAYLLRFSSDALVSLVFAGFFVTLLTSIDLLEKSGIRLITEHATAGLLAQPFLKLKGFVNGQWLDKLLCCAFLILLPLYTWQLAHINDHFTLDIYILSVILLAFLFWSLMWPRAQRRFHNWFDRMNVYTFNALLVYLSHIAPTKSARFIQIEWVAFVSLGLLVFFTIFLGRRPRFDPSPMDVLVLLVGLLMAFALPLVDVENYSLAIVQFIVLLYGFELMMNVEQEFPKKIMPWVFSLSMIGVVVQGVI